MNQDSKNKEIRQYLDNYGNHLKDVVSEHADEVKGLARRKNKIDDSAIIDPTAEVHPSAIIEANVKIYPYAKIGPRVIIREGSVIGTNSVVAGNSELDRNTIIGEDCILGENVFTTDGTNIGNRVKIGNTVILSANNKISNGVEIGSRVYFRAWVTVKTGAIVGDDVVLDRSAVVGTKAMIGAKSVLEDGAEVKTKAQIINSFLADGVTIGPEIAITNSYIDAGRTIHININDGFSGKDDVMSIDPISNPKVKISAAAAKKLRTHYEKGTFGKFNKEFLEIIFPDKSDMVRNIRECLDSIVDEMKGGIASTREALDYMEGDTKKSLTLIAQKDKFSHSKLVDNFSVGMRDKLLPGLMQDLCYNFSDFKELLRELSEGNNYVFSAIDPADRKYKHKYYATEKALADDLLNSVNINLLAAAAARGVEKSKS